MMDIPKLKEWLDGATHRKPNWPLAGYAPGGYMGKCLGCHAELMNMDKRATLCLACAVDEVKDALATYRAKLDEAQKENETLRAAIRIVSG